MNKKNKVLLSAAGMLVLTAAAASASTFAWFTTVRNATINYTQASVYTDAGSLEVTFVSSLHSSWTSTPLAPTSNLVIGGNHSITDISGNGETFYKPVWNAFDTSSTVADSIDAYQTAGAGDADGLFIDFKINIARTNGPTGTGMKVYLGPTTDIVPVSAAVADIAAVNSSRLAVMNADDSLKMIWAPESDGTLLGDHKYIKADAAVTDPLLGVYGLAGYSMVQLDGSGVDTDLFWDIDIPEHTTITAADAAGNLPVIADLSVAEDVDVSFRAWIEGTDPDCTNTALAGLFNINISLYGLAVA